MRTPFAPRAAALLLAIGAAAGQAQQLSCDGLRDQIDAKIRATGVSTFTLTIVDSAASAPGRNVGSCERGSRKILYVQSDGPSGAASTPPSASPAPRPVRAASAAAPRPPVVITECRDGSAPSDGRCR